MWEAIEKILVSSNAITVLVFLVIMMIVLAILAKTHVITIQTSAVKIGGDEKERNIIRQQVEWARVYIMSLEAKIATMKSDYDEYFTKYILERVYDEVVDWITFNHLNLSSAYIEIKQEKVCALVYSLNVEERFKTKEFKQRMYGWIREIIERLVQIREVFK